VIEKIRPQRPQSEPSNDGPGYPMGMEDGSLNELSSPRLAPVSVHGARETIAQAKVLRALTRLRSRDRGNLDALLRRSR